MITKLCSTSLLASVVFWNASALAQTGARVLSPDGSYWVEVEMTIFSSTYSGGSERPVPVKNLRYLGSLRRLQHQSDSYYFPFEFETRPGDAGAGGVSQAVPDLIGPEFSPADPQGFKVFDVEHDPYLQLDRRFWRFSQNNTKLQSTGEHTVLWHQVWRQPLKPRALAASVLVEAGETFGLHHQLEGSVRISSQGDSASIEALLWLSQFTQDQATVKGEWFVPEVPALPAGISLGSNEPVTQKNEGEWRPLDVWVLNQNREIGPNALYYLDHPAMGVLVELRPYTVPEITVPVLEPVAGDTRRAFE